MTLRGVILQYGSELSTDFLVKNVAKRINY